MTDEAPTRSYKPIWWALVIVAFLALSAWTYIGTKRSNHETQQASASGVGVGTAYDPTTGRTVGAGALPGALGTGGTPPATVAPEVVTAPTSAPAAAGTDAAPGR